MRHLAGTACITTLLIAFQVDCHAEAPLHQRIDQFIAAKAKADGSEPAALTDDAEFLRRVWLDFAGRIPTATTTEAFLVDTSRDKRARVIDELLDADSWSKRMTDLFHVMLMERRGEDDGWNQWLEDSFQANKPWDQLVREILDPNGENEATRGAAFFMTKRLEKYGQNPTDYPGLVRDVGRMFLGMDLQCAECHDHLFIDDYKQVDFKGLFAVYQNTFIRRDVKFPAIGEKAMTAKLEFVSVFDPDQQVTGPAIPGGREFSIPEPKPVDPKQPKPKTPPPRPDWSALRAVAHDLASPENSQFARNTVNRVWFALMGRGIVHPLDLHHSSNPPSHPDLLDALATDFAAHKFDVKWLQREIALSETYQRSTRQSIPTEPFPEELFLAGLERRLSSEQLMWSVLAATDQTEIVPSAAPASEEDDGDENQEDTADASIPAITEIRAAFLAAMANDAREPEEAVSSTVKGALFWRNSDVLQRLVRRRSGNLLDRLAAEDDDTAVVESMFVNVLSRHPEDVEKAAFVEFIAGQDDRQTALRDALWALLTSTEFYVNH